MGLREKVELFLEATLSSAEDPRESIRALVRDLRARQASGRRALGLSLSLEKKLLDELIAAEDAAASCERESKEALQRSDEGTAREAAARLLDLRKREEDARARWKEQRATADKVRLAVSESSRRIDDVAHAHTVLLARAHCAEAAKSIADTLALLDSAELKVTLGKASLAVERAESMGTP